MPCDIPDEQMGRIIGAIMLPEAWQERLLAKLHLVDEVNRVEQEREQVQQFKRLGQVQVHGHMGYEDYLRQKRRLEEKLGELVVPGVDAVQEARKLLEDLPRIWSEANLSEQRRILVAMLDGVYVDTVAVRPLSVSSPSQLSKPCSR